uniref:Metalloendopeptidase n=1 Tax=Strongyloides stercoralis TaxID=6248 RepID=A0A0K0DV79_STRER
MKCIKINLSIFLYITIVYCFGKFENYKENNISLINNNERIKRSISFQRYQDKLKNNDHYKKKRMFLSQLRNKVEISIPYYVEHNVNYQLVDLALQFIQQETCLKFVKQQKMIPTSLGLQYSFGSKCTSSTEKKTNKQWKKISIASDCSNIESIQRETMHLLGFIYTQNRYDKDKYLLLIKKNINHRYLYKF